jgi:hypothetical protein
MPAMSAPNYDDPTDPYTLVNSPWGRIEQWRASALATGEMGAYSEYLKSIRFDAVDAETKIALADEREQELQAREQAVRDVAASLSALMRRVDGLIAREERRRDEERARRAEQAEPIELPPGAEPEPTTAQEDDTHVPGGELHDVPPKDPEQDLLAEPPETNDAGGVPLSYGNVPTSYIRSRTEDRSGDLPPGIETRVPLDPGPYFEPDPAELAHPQEPPAQPVAIEDE